MWFISQLGVANLRAHQSYSAIEDNMFKNNQPDNIGTIFSWIQTLFQNLQSYPFSYYEKSFNWAFHIFFHNLSNTEISSNMIRSSHSFGLQFVAASDKLITTSLPSVLDEAFFMLPLSLKFFKTVLNFAKLYSFSKCVMYTEKGLSATGSLLNIIAIINESDTCTILSTR